jgi:mannitol-1-phosphate 5-dehydrogenase
MASPSIEGQVRKVLQETGACLVKKHGFDAQDHSRYIDKIIERFRNSCLIDEVVRVARSPIRKLSRNDRLVLPALQSFGYGVIPEYLTLIMAAALLFDFEDDAEAAELQAAIQASGIRKTIEQVTGIPEGHHIHDLIMQHYHSLKQACDTHS